MGPRSSAVGNATSSATAWAWCSGRGRTQPACKIGPPSPWCWRERTTRSPAGPPVADQGLTGSGRAWSVEHPGWRVEIVQRPPPRGEWRGFPVPEDSTRAATSTGADFRHATVPRPAPPPLGRPEHVQLVRPERAAGQGLRAPLRDQRGHDLRDHQPSHAAEARPCLNLLSQLLVHRRCRFAPEALDKSAPRHHGDALSVGSTWFVA